MTAAMDVRAVDRHMIHAAALAPSPGQIGGAVTLAGTGATYFTTDVFESVGGASSRLALERVRVLVCSLRS